MRKTFPYVGAVYLLVFQHNQVLLLKRHNTSYYDGRYSVPAGHMDGHELPTEAMIREGQEELGLVIDKKQLLSPLTLFRICKDGIDNERFEMFFSIQHQDGTIINNEPDKCSELFRCDIDILPENTIPYIREVIQAYTQGIRFLEVRE